jgi:predicted ArsR family transcriptional regulator
MGQSEILQLLEEIKKPLSRSQIAEKLMCDACQVSHHLAKLVIHQEVKVIEIDRNQAKEYFKGNAPSRRMRLYYC